MNMRFSTVLFSVLLFASFITPAYAGGNNEGIKHTGSASQAGDGATSGFSDSGNGSAEATSGFSDSGNSDATGGASTSGATVNDTSSYRHNGNI